MKCAPTIIDRGLWVFDFVIVFLRSIITSQLSVCSRRWFQMEPDCCHRVFVFFVFDASYSCRNKIPTSFLIVFLGLGRRDTFFRLIFLIVLHFFCSRSNEKWTNLLVVISDSSQCCISSVNFVSFLRGILWINQLDLLSWSFCRYSSALLHHFFTQFLFRVCGAFDSSTNEKNCLGRSVDALVRVGTFVA